jgi:hypothetical protein
MNHEMVYETEGRPADDGGDDIDDDSEFETPEPAWVANLWTGDRGETIRQSFLDFHPEEAFI